jgi:hypothetical protein
MQRLNATSGAGRGRMKPRDFRSRIGWGAAPVALVAALGCGESGDFNASHPERGPSEMLGGRAPLNVSFSGGSDVSPALGALKANCDADCERYCDSVGFENPINRGLCGQLWGIGQAPAVIDATETCRRLFVDTVGRFPTAGELNDQCLSQDYATVVQQLIDSDEFVRVNRRRWADRLRYDMQSVSVERIYDADRVVTLAYQGRIPFDQFAAVISAHPVLTRQKPNALERVDLLYQLFLGRPAFANERSDMSRLYRLWDNDYYDHPQLGMRLPDAFIRFDCNDDDGIGPCTSLRFGPETLVLEPDSRADLMENRYKMWSGYLTAREWEALQAPGRLVATLPVFWEYAASQVLEQYLGYNLTRQAPAATQRLVQYLIDYQGDIRAAHYAVLTSIAYRQSNRALNLGVATAASELPRYQQGPVQQVEAETWVDSLRRMGALPERRCDLVLSRPEEFMESDSPSALSLVQRSDWGIRVEEGEFNRDYRDLVRTLGGCPDHSQGGRFKVISVLSTANQLNFAGQICDPGDNDDDLRVPSEVILPPGVGGASVVDENLAQAIVEHQTALFYGRAASAEEVGQARQYGAECALARCNAEQFARPACFALLSSAEMLFY